MVTAPGERHTTRPFAVGPFEFTVTTSDDRDRLLVESCFGDLPETLDASAPMGIYSLVAEAKTRSWVVSGPRLSRQSVTTLAAALKFLVTAVNLAALDAEPEYLHLHSGVATYGGRAVVIVAERDTGKTTTVAHLVARGWAFVTDETARLSPDAAEISGFPKPLSIKPDGRESVEHLEPWMLPRVGDDPGDFRFVPVGASGATVSAGGAPHVVVLLRRPMADEVSTGPVVREVHPADATVALMQQTLDAERFGSAAFALARLAAASHCYEVTTGTPSETADAIESQFAQDRAEPLPVCLLPSSDAFTSGVTSVAVADRVVVHDLESGRIFALDAGGTQVWRRLGGWDAADEIDLDGPVIKPFVAQLRALGVLARAA